jgi:hypothetical protein
MIDGAELRRKLQVKAGARMLLMQVPPAFASALTDGGEVVAIKPGNACDGAIAFCGSPAEVEALAPRVISVLPADGLLWFAYRKGAAAKKSGLSRDTGWSPLLELGFETVRSIAFDDEWTGLRFRHSSAVKARR